MITFEGENSNYSRYEKKHLSEEESVGVENAIFHSNEAKC
jgi:hypothetical protein